MESVTFWDITPCSLMKANQHFGGTAKLLAACFMLIS
jgi:hypothetical protein